MLTSQDKQAMILFVEGASDTQFMSRLVPNSERVNTTVYSIDSVEIPTPVLGGNRGRLIWLADQLRGEAHLLGRVLCLIDADNDYITGVSRAHPILITDYCDLESYVMNDCSLAHILFHFGEEISNIGNLKTLIYRCCEKIKILRVVNEIGGFEMRINFSVEGKVGRHLTGAGFSTDINETKLTQSIFSNSTANSSDRAAITAEVLRIRSIMTAPPEHVLHAKDMTDVVSSLFKVSRDEVARVIMSAISACLHAIRNLPNVSRMELFLRS
jgi:hypothetical protein